MSDIQGAVETAIVNALSANASLTALVDTNIYQEQAPAKTPPPYVVFLMVSGLDDSDHPIRSLQFDYQFDAIATDRQKARQIAGYIDDSLHHQALTISGWTNYWIAGLKQMSLTENIDGSQVYRRIRVFNIRICL